MGILSSVLLFWAIWGGMDFVDAGISSELCDFYVPSDYNCTHCQSFWQPLTNEECRDQAMKGNELFRNSTYETIQEIDYPARWYPCGCSYVQTALTLTDKTTGVTKWTEVKTAYYQWFAMDYDDKNLAKTFQPTDLTKYVCNGMQSSERIDSVTTIEDTWTDRILAWTFSCMCYKPAEVTNSECCNDGFECGMDMEFRCKAYSYDGCSKCGCNECDKSLFCRIASVNDDPRLAGWRKDNTWRIADSQTMSSALDKNILNFKLHVM